MKRARKSVLNNGTADGLLGCVEKMLTDDQQRVLMAFYFNDITL